MDPGEVVHEARDDLADPRRRYRGLRRGLAISDLSGLVQATSARQVGAGEVPAPLPWVPSPVLAPCVAGQTRDFLRADAGHPIRRPRGRIRLARRAARVPAVRRALPLAPATRQPPPPCSACAGVTGRPAQASNTSQRSPSIGFA